MICFQNTEHIVVQHVRHPKDMLRDSVTSLSASMHLNHWCHEVLIRESVYVFSSPEWLIHRKTVTVSLVLCSLFFWIFVLLKFFSLWNPLKETTEAEFWADKLLWLSLFIHTQEKGKSMSLSSSLADKVSCLFFFLTSCLSDSSWSRCLIICLMVH